MGEFITALNYDKGPITGSPEVRPIIPVVTKGAPAKPGSKYDARVGIQRVTEQTPQRSPLLKGVTDDATSAYDFREFLQAEDVDGHVARTFQLTIEQCLKEGFEITGSDEELVKGIQRRLKVITKASDTTMYTLVEDLISGLTKFNNGMLVLTRKEYSGSDFKPFRFRGRNLKPLSGIFYVEPQHMTPKRKNGKIYEWEYENNDVGSEKKQFKPESIFHVFYNRKGSDVFGTPWILPALDDVRMLRRLEEFVQMLISKHLFPIYQYKVGTKEHPAIEFDGGTSEVQLVQAQVQDMPQQGCVFTSHRHEIIAIDSKGALDISKYLEHFEKRALSSLGLSEVDLGRGDTANRGTAQVMNQTRVDRCTRIQRVLSEYFNDIIIFSLLLELGKDPFDPQNEVTLKFNAINTEEKRAREQHCLQMFQNDGIDHDEYRKDLNRKPFTEQQWEKSFSNTTKRIAESQSQESNLTLEKQKSVTKQNTSPANQTNKTGKTKPTISKND
jgi:hypothetical protein